VITATVTFDFSKLHKFRNLLNGSSRWGDWMLRQWAARYRGFAQRRFNKASKGDGTWAKLQPATIARRRKGEYAGKQVGKRRRRAITAAQGTVAILRDTGLLFAALNPQLNSQGGIEQVSRNSLKVTVGYGGPAGHPGTRLTIADLARIHNEGMGNVPRRQIIVNPDRALEKAMARDAETALKRMWNDVK